MVEHIYVYNETLFSGFAITKCADQPARARRLISAFVIRFLVSIIRFKFLASLCIKGDWFGSRFVGNSKDRLSRVAAHIIILG